MDALLAQRVLGTTLVSVAVLCLAWDLYDLVKQAGKHSVSEWIRGTWLSVPAGIALGALTAAHFIRWPWR